MFTPNQHTQLELSPRFATVQTFSPLLQQSTICQACHCKNWDYLLKNRPRCNSSSACYPWSCIWSIRICSSLCAFIISNSLPLLAAMLSLEEMPECSQVGEFPPSVNCQPLLFACVITVIIYLCHHPVLLSRVRQAEPCGKFITQGWSQFLSATVRTEAPQGCADPGEGRVRVTWLTATLSLLLGHWYCTRNKLKGVTSNCKALDTAAAVARAQQKPLLGRLC